VGYLAIEIFCYYLLLKVSVGEGDAFLILGCDTWLLQMGQGLVSPLGFGMDAKLGLAFLGFSEWRAGVGICLKVIL